jgi:hypothetical protein
VNCRILNCFYRNCLASVRSRVSLLALESRIQIENVFPRGRIQVPFQDVLAAQPRNSRLAVDRDIRSLSLSGTFRSIKQLDRHQRRILSFHKPQLPQTSKVPPLTGRQAKPYEPERSDRTATKGHNDSRRWQRDYCHPPQYGGQQGNDGIILALWLKSSL